MIDNIQENRVHYPDLTVQSLWEEPTCGMSAVIGALPPGAQRSRELFTMITDLRLLQIVQDAEMIETIEKTATGYKIYTDKFSLEVTVKYLPHPPNYAGPILFELEFGTPNPYGDVHILPYPLQLGILPPAEQRIRELAEIFRRLPDVIGYVDPVQNIQKTETGYFIRTENSSVVVDVIYHNPQDTEPVEFELQFGRPK